MRLLLLLLTATLTKGAWPLLGSEIVFTRDVKPILVKRCYGCHGAEQQMGSFRLDQKERAMIAGRGEPAIVPGNSAQSLMYRRISGMELGPQMPLTGPLSVEIEFRGDPWPALAEVNRAMKASRDKLVSLGLS